jgi:hypothetical protein
VKGRNWGRELQLRFVAGDVKAGAVVRLEFGKHWNVSASGELLGVAYEWRAESHREVDGVKRSSAPMFVGTFAHAGGTSGAFHLRRQHEELLTLGVLGAPHSVRGIITEPSSPDCAVEIIGLPEMELRLEHSTMYSPTKLDAADIRAAGHRNFYVGYCLDQSGDSVLAPPALAVVTALVLADALLIREFYLRRSDIG